VAERHPAPRLFGVETEYAVTGFDARGQPVDRAAVVEAVMRQACSSLPHLRDEFSNGMFLQNGARFYVDAGHHPELTTPECNTPWDVVRYIAAGEQMLADLAAGVPKRRVAQVVFYRCNVDYAGTQSTWGCHSSYMHRADPAALPAHIIPHLVSRLIYTGAGGFNNRSPGIEFMLSPRVAHMATDVSSDSTHGRGIFHSKDEPLCGNGYHRLHLLCGESLCSQLATWLKVATTALVVALIEAGGRPGDAVALRAPVSAMNTFAGDPTCTAVAPTVDGRRLRALDIQRHYLGLVEARLREMPPWAKAGCALWRRVLDQLDSGPQAVAASLDWAIKLPLYKDRVRRRGLAWESLALWNRVAQRLAQALEATGQRPQPLRAELLQASSGPLAEQMKQLGPFLQSHGMSWNTFRTFLGVRQELFEIDVRFGELGEQGIFTRLDTAGVLDHQVSGVDNIASAMTEPPPIPRARLRGALVRELANDEERYSCDWEGVWDFRERRMIDLRDPFNASSEWKAWPSDEELARAGGPRSRLFEHIWFLRDLERLPGRRRATNDR